MRNETQHFGYIYDAFGNLRDHFGSSDNRYLYAGEQCDPNAGLYYLRARYYDPENGRFMTHDPHPGNPYEPITLHRYLYAGANPVMYADPGGEFMSLTEAGEVFTTLTIMYMQSAIINATVNHMYSAYMNAEPFVWHGWLGIGHTAGTLTPGVGGMLVWLNEVERVGGNQKKSVNAVYGVIFPFGYSLGGKGASVTSFDIYTPGLLGADPVILQGSALYMAASGHIGVGGKWWPSWLSKWLPDNPWIPKPNSGVGIGYGGTVLYMGMGVSRSFGKIYGHDSGIDILTGICIKIWSDS